MGLARRAGELTTGEDKVLQGIRHGHLHFVFIAKDSGQATFKKIDDKCHYYQVPCSNAFTRQEISQAIGQSRSIIGVKQPGFSQKFQKLMQNINEGE